MFLTAVAVSASVLERLRRLLLAYDRAESELFGLTRRSLQMLPRCLAS